MRWLGRHCRTEGRDVAQPGSASHWGCGGRRFESSRPDQFFDIQQISIALSLQPYYFTAAVLYYGAYAFQCPADRFSDDQDMLDLAVLGDFG